MWRVSEVYGNRRAVKGGIGMDEYEDFEMCLNDDCEFCEDGFCMKDNYYAECPFEDSEV